MRSVKAILSVISTVGAVFYCGSLLYYFFDLSGSVEELQTGGLGPTVLGLGIIGLIFCLVLIVKLMRLFAGPNSGSGVRKRPETSRDDEESAFDADAIVARYLAQRPMEPAPQSPSAGPRPGGGGPAKRPGFGRRVS